MNRLSKTIAVLAVMLCTVIIAQDIAGDYRLNAVKVRYTGLNREAAPVIIQATHQYTYLPPVAIDLAVIPVGMPVYQFINGPFSSEMLSISGVNLNLSLELKIVFNVPSS